MSVTLPVIHPNHSHWSRKRLPQIQDTEAFTEWLTARGIGHRIESLAASRLRATQNEIDLAKVDRLLHAGLDTIAYPVVVSRDHYILDGHHRAWAARVLASHIRAVVVDLTHEGLVRVAGEWVGAGHQAILDQDVIVEHSQAATV